MKRKLWIVFAVLLLSTAALLAVATRTWADFVHSSDVPLSYSWEPCSAIKPRLATSPNGHQLAAAWVQEVPIDGGCSSGGFGLLRWATEESSYSGWSSPLQVFLNRYTTTSCVTHIDVAVDGDNVAHVVATIQEPCDLEETTSTSLHYRACALSDGDASCGEDVTIISEDPQSTSFYLLEAAITVSADGSPFVVYGRRQIEGSSLSSQVNAAHLSGDTWTTFKLSGSERAYRPAITWAQASNGTGYDHIVWETHDTPTLASWTNGRVQYLRCLDNATSLTNCGNVKTFLTAGVYPRPAVAASGAPYDRVLIAWNRFDTLDPDALDGCEEFGVHYYRSDNNGTNFYDSNMREVLSEQLVSAYPYGQAKYKYAGIEEGEGAGGEEYFPYLRPAVDMDSVGRPVVAWQLPIGTYPYPDTYVITTTRVLTWNTEGGLAWQTEERWGTGEGLQDDHLNPDIALASRDHDPNGVHMVFMKREWYDGEGDNDYNVYRIAYSYTGTLFEEPTPIPTTDESLPATPTATIPPNPYQSTSTIYLPVVLRART